MSVMLIKDQSYKPLFQHYSGAAFDLPIEEPKYDCFVFKNYNNINNLNNMQYY